jgi:hypothetical protein
MRGTLVCHTEGYKMVRFILHLVMTVSAVAVLESSSLSPDQIETPNGTVVAKLITEGSREEIILKFPRTATEMLVWRSPDAKQEASVEYGKERVSRLMWSAKAEGNKDYFLVTVTELQRYGDVYDPHAIYVFSTQTGEMLWKKVFGRRWRELVACSTESGLVATVIPVAENAYDDAVVVFDAQTAREINAIYLSEIKQRIAPSAVGVERIDFATKNRLKIELYGESDKELFNYLWRFGRKG